MDIRFETINGQLCRMVEPEPLMPDSQYPCAVKLVGGNDTPLGRYNNSTVCCSRDFDPIVACGTGSLKFHYSRYEIIGYPVADGSAEWALWQRQNKRSVITDTGVVMHYNYDDETCNALLRVYPTGWQLYEPEPAKEPIADCDNCKHVCTQSNIDYCHMYEPKPAYKVGDWVRGKCGYDYEITAYPSKFAPDSPDIYDATPISCMDGLIIFLEFSEIERKLDPSEVVVHIGCLSGTVRPVAGETFTLNHNKATFSTIRLDALDTETRSLVERLLKAQEEK